MQNFIRRLLIVPMLLAVAGISIVNAPLQADENVAKGLPEQPAVRRVKYPAQPPVAERIKTALNEITEGEFVETRLSEALEFLADFHDITIILDETSLQKANIKLHSPVTLNLSGVKLRAVLEKLLDPLGLTWKIEDEVLKVTVKPKEKNADAANPVPPAQTKAEAALSARTECNFVRTSLREAVAYFADKHKVEIDLDGDALKNVGVTLNVGVREKLSNVTLRRAFRTILDRYELVALAKGEEIVITSKEAASRGKTVPVDGRIKSELNQSNEFEFKDVALADALDFFAALHDINIILDKQALRKAEINPDSPISAAKSGGKLRDGLKTILDPLGLTWKMVEGNVLVVTVKPKSGGDS